MFSILNVPVTLIDVINVINEFQITNPDDIRPELYQFQHNLWREIYRAIPAAWRGRQVHRAATTHPHGPFRLYEFENPEHRSIQLRVRPATYHLAFAILATVSWPG